MIVNHKVIHGGAYHRQEVHHRNQAQDGENEEIAH
jgi:hypothetical protein